MRVRANASPSGAYSIERQPDKAGHVCVRFYENAHKITDDNDVTFWEYDEYTLVIPNRPSLAAEIEENYSAWIETAKSLE